MENSIPMLELKGISKSFPGVRALSDVDVALHSGEVVSIVGQNGAGKSTLMSIIGGIHAPDEGTIAIDGQRVEINSPADAERLRIGFVHQEPTLIPSLSVAANIFLSMERVKAGCILDFRTMRSESVRLAKMLGFDLDPDWSVEDLSVVESEVVEVAKAMLVDPQILILDEVTAPLDGEGVDRLFELIAVLKQQGLAIIFISHRLNEVIDISDRVIVMRDGVKVAELDTAEGVSERRIIDLMVGDQGAPPLEDDDGPRHQDAQGELLSVRGLTRFPDFKDVSFTVSRGEIVGFAGLKGSGISPLFKTMFGALKGDRGEVSVLGREVAIRAPADAIEAGIGMLTNDRQREGLALSRSVGDNLSISSLESFRNRFRLLRRRELHDRTSTVARALSIKTPSMEQESMKLSGGNQQKIVLGKWILRDLEILITDEPTRGVDVRAKADIYRLLLELKRAGKCVLVASPEVSELLAVCDRVVVLDDGQIVGEVQRHDASFTEPAILEMIHAVSH